MNCRLLLLAGGLFSTSACFRSSADGTADEIPDTTVDIAVQLTASPSSVLTNGTPAMISVAALPVTATPSLITIESTNGELSIAGSAPSQSVDLPWMDGGLLGTVRITAAAGAIAGESVRLTASATGLVVAVTGDTLISIEDPPSIGTTVTLGQEEIEVTAGWTVSVHWDFSSDYVYRSDDFTEDTGPKSNSLTSIVVMSAPFPVGLAIGGGRKVVVLPESGPYSERDYAPSSNDSGGPDAIRDLAFFPSWPPTGNAALYVASSSSNGGDGLYRIDSDWSILREVMDNNVKMVLPDQLGEFDGIGNSVLYYKTGSAVILYPGTDLPILYGAHACALVPGPAMACSRPENNPPTEVVILRIVTHSTASITVAGRTSAKPVAVGLGPTAEALVIMDNSELLDLNSDGTVDVYLRSVSPGWSWIDLAVPPAGHPLATTATTYYLLEQNTALNIERVLRIDGP